MNNVKANINSAFKDLRKEGYFAKQNFWCCQTCGWADVSDDKRKTAVFYSQQDTKTLKDNGYCYLSWAGDGNKIVEIFKRNNVKTEWNGKSETRIKMFI